MSTKKYLYAAVGAQLAVVKSAQAKLEELMAKVNENATSTSKDMQSRIDVWAGEGEQFLGKVSDTKAIDELTSKVDFDQMQTQVNKLRDQLEDIVSTWRANFRPAGAEKVTVSASVTTAATAPAAKAPTAKTTATKKPAAKKPAAKKPATKASTAKTTATKKPAAKKPAARTSAAKKPAAKTAAKTTATKKPVSKAS
ncbi:MAG: hypothetical protein WD532_08655 [Acidimicrobiia bacterium]